MLTALPPNYGFQLAPAGRYVLRNARKSSDAFVPLYVRATRTGEDRFILKHDISDRLISWFRSGDTALFVSDTTSGSRGFGYYIVHAPTDSRRRLAI